MVQLKLPTFGLNLSNDSPKDVALNAVKWRNPAFSSSQ